MPARHMTAEGIAEIRRLRRDEKLEIGEVARRTGWSRNVVVTYGAIDPKPLEGKDAEIAARLIAGEPQSVIWRSAGVSQVYVSRLFRRLVAEGKIPFLDRSVAPLRSNGYGPEIGSHREAVLAYLTEHPSESFTSREIGQALSADIKKVEYAVDVLRRAGKIEATKPGKGGPLSARDASATNGQSPSGDHAMWYGIRVANRRTIAGNGIEAARVARQMREAALRTAVLKVLGEAHHPYETVAALIAELPEEPKYAASEVQALLHTLNRLGLVKFRVDRDGKHQRLRRIECLPAGRREAGIEPIPAALQPQHRTDRTDYRTHGFAAEGSGPIERETYAEHVARFPDHGHNLASVMDRLEFERELESPATTPAVTPPGTPLVVPAASGAPGREWPVLAALRERLAKDERRAKLLEEAAELTEDADDRELIQVHAATAREGKLTDIEREYLAFADAVAEYGGGSHD